MSGGGGGGGGSGEGGAAPKKSQAEETKEIALKIYIGLASLTFAYLDNTGAERKRPAPKPLALMSFKLAEAFQQADAEVNAAALAVERARNTFKAEDLDLASLHTPKT